MDLWKLDISKQMSIVGEDTPAEVRAMSTFELESEKVRLTEFKRSTGLTIEDYRMLAFIERELEARLPFR